MAPPTPDPTCPGSKTSEGRWSFWLLAALLCITGVAIWKHQWILAAASVLGKAGIMAAYSVSRGIVKAFSALNPADRFARWVGAFFERHVMSAVPSNPVPATTSTVNATLGQLAAKIDSTDTAELLSLMLAGGRYGVKKLERLVEKSSIGQKHAPEIQAAEAIVNSQV